MLKTREKKDLRGYLRYHIKIRVMIDYVDVLFYKLLDKAGLPKMRFHDLRHSMATILLAAGVHPKVVQERLGHSSIKITMDVYSHVLPSMQDDVARMLGEMFKDE